MGNSSIFYTSKNKAYQQAVSIIQGTPGYVVNNPDAARKKSMQNIRVADSTLCSIIPINSGTSQYIFNTNDTPNLGNQGGLLPQEIRLSLQDVFFTYALGFYLVVLNQPWEFQYLTFPSANLLGGPAPLFANPVTLCGLWFGGRLEVKVNGEQVTPTWDMSDHMTINQTQANYGAPGGGNPFFDQQDLATDGFKITEPNWIVNGGNKNLYTLTYGNNYADIWAGGPQFGYQLGLVMKWKGWLAQNASSIMNNEPAKM